ncbi:PASTA domain-containing protein [Ornithobacterium rhinotracheale]|uniref:PASTA domain-containing protein n=1 Tax=Ornithobacterium rhinotracheale TaxID=28251 RepID=A0A3R5WYL2_ORNRH|nr:penicillin-binding protein [Ornithobacterium rhinotracheale]QAR30081.1 PASTA domain-containing protein [Ornithobacterium rhinotracheale]
MTDNQNKNLKLRGYIVAASFILALLGVLAKLSHLQMAPGERKKFEEFAQKTNFREAIIPAQRGSLYAADGSLLATSIKMYDIAIDGKAMRQDLIDKDLNALSDSLHTLFGKPANYYAKLILKAKEQNKQYVKIASGLNFQQLKRLKNFPIFKKGQIKGGLIIEDRLERERSVKDIGSRTLGYVKDSVKVGLEGAYNELLAGKDGRRLEQRMGGGNWKPIDINNEISAEEGYDVVTTIDIPLQNVAYNALYDQLSQYEAEYGCIIIMEVKTGEIKAIANLTRLKDGNYADIQNFAVGEAAEPGSTIKTISLLAALKEGIVDTATTVQTGGGRAKLFGRIISDSYGYGTINVRQVLEKSSNIGTAKIITNAYQSNPKKFLNIITKEWKMGEPLGVDIPGEAQPFFPDPDKKSWSKQSLSSVSFGYESKITPLQILTFYNGIANGGVMLKPLFVKEIRKKGELIKKFEPTVRVAKMAQDSTIKKMQNMLAAVMKKGTGRAFNNKDYPSAGKTGTARVEYWIKNQPVQYRASFCGYFPADNPQYSCYVMAHKPSRNKGFYGGTVAGPIFKAVADYVYVNTPKTYLAENKKINTTNKERKSFELKNNKIPNLKGKLAYEVIPALENAGLKVSYSGLGKIVNQSLPEGTSIKKGTHIHLALNHL